MVPDLSDSDGGTRPRIAGEREQQILDAALFVLAEVGYDRLTMDAVASQAKASKATLYRRWESKATLVIDALISQKTSIDSPPDTGTLRGDLLAAFCAVGGLSDQHQVALLASVITAVGRDQEFAEAYRERFIAPKAELTRVLFQRARDRGELRDDIDLELISAALPGIVLHRIFLLGDQPSSEMIARVIDQVILPAATRG